ncbi:MAG: UDP-2,3-diacylglucosamine diphosphatase LpxI [Alphaproteobacteria bacterium]|nr:UDP-2,3-diacylglucosamine diphosphatase LpxI [Alphaproteobacteria bacterium]
MSSIERLGVIAGSGKLPLEIAEAAAENGIKVHVFVLRDQGDSTLFEDRFPTFMIRLGAAAEAISLVREQKVQDIVFAGGVRRPSFKELSLDATAAKILGKGLFRLGDDGLLRSVIRYLEEHEGFRVHAVDEFLNSHKPRAGQIGDVALPDHADADIRRGIDVLDALAPQDVGQATVIQNGLVLGIEAIEGTAALLARCGPLRRDCDGPVLVKMSKPEQTGRADLPTIGPDTIDQAQEAGLSGIAIEAERSLIVSRDETIRRANAAGLFLVAVTRDSPK